MEGCGMVYLRFWTVFTKVALFRAGLVPLTSGLGYDSDYK